MLEVTLRGYYFLAEAEILGLRPARTTLKFYQNETFGSALIPNQSGWFVPETKEYQTFVKVNSQGWVDSEHSIQKPPGVFRILIVGDSFVENLQVPLENSFFKQLERSLKNKYGNVEIIALGRGNTGTAQQLLILKNYGLIYKPDLVIQMFFSGNDVKNNSLTLQKDPYLPYYILDENSNLKLIPEQKKLTKGLSKVKETARQLRIVELLLSFRQKFLERIAVQEYGYPLDYHIYDDKYSKEYEEAWRVTKKLILESNSISEQSGAKYLLVTLANNEQVNQEVWIKALKTYPAMKKNNLDPDKPDKILGSFCQAEKLSCIFMLPDFRQFVKEYKKPTHFPLDGHWNKEGTNLAARILSDYLSGYFLSSDK